MGIGLQLVNPPAVTEPVSVAQLKEFLRVQYDTENALIASLGKAARVECERYTNRCITAQTWKQTHDCFPKTIELLRSPVTAVTHLKYYDTSGVQQTLETSAYAYDLTQDPVRIIPAYASWWPSIREGLLSQIEVQFVAGYVDTQVEREALEMAIKELVRHWWENRGTAEVPKAIYQTLDPYVLPIL